MERRPYYSWTAAASFALRAQYRGDLEPELADGAAGWVARGEDRERNRKS